ncbi:hypothetical protein [Raoultibacter phocaeensis]|uniref:hypothetical protein n=1 Tax=Raoultibacter phocaeensis TaxID=2479841 RepID=UPI001118C5D5|nr:hypothetical protein [Raoultibacter phocaeensis]
MGDNGSTDNGIFEASKASLLLATRRELPDAMPPCAGFVPQNPYGWVSNALPAPGKDEKYIVEFLGKTTYRIIAYLDKYARVFATDHPITCPPATAPTLSVARYADESTDSCERGCIQVLEADGSQRLVAEYRFEHGRYSIEGSWFNFGSHAQGLLYEEFVTRAYLAFVYRPALCNTQPPLYGIGNVGAELEKARPLDAFERIGAAVAGADADPALTAPGLERCLVRWLGEAGLGSEQAGSLKRLASGDPLRLVRTKRYADTYYLGTNDEEAAASYRRMIWALEGALNRFLLTSESLGDRVDSAFEHEAAQWDYYLIESIAKQMPFAENPADIQGETAGEWAVRKGIASAVERLRLPFRLTADFRVNAKGGIAAFDAVVPSASIMPHTRWPEGAPTWSEVPLVEREAQAGRYAMRLAIMLAAIAFSQSKAIERVVVAARPVSDRSETVEGSSEFPQEDELPRMVSVEFERSAFCANGAYRQAAEGDPAWFFTWFNALIGRADIPSPLEDGRLAAPERALMPELSDDAVPAFAHAALGAKSVSDLAVNYNAKRRHIAEQMADDIAQAATTTERVRIVSAVKDKTPDLDVQDACTRLMVALTADEIDPGDQNAIVNRFLGEDELMTALAAARSAAERGDGAEAVSLLAQAIGQAELSGRFADTAETAFRCFDSYASRVVYNRARQAGGGAPGASSVPAFAHDAGRTVELAPDSLYFCCLEAVKLLEHSFDRTEEALGYGKRCIELAPVSGPGYLQTARAYMLVGDMDNTIATINRYLEVALLPNEIAMGYYQLAYAQWKAGRLQAGVAGYLKSMTTSPLVYDQARLELEELLNEPEANLIPADEIDGVLEENGVVVAPAEALFEQLLEASEAAVDAGLFVVARSVLAAYCQHRPDDALVNVLRSLGD